MKNPDLRRNTTLLFLAVFAVAFVLRAVFVMQWNETPYGLSPLLDAQVYNDWAQEIAKGHLLRVRAFYASPLYPYLLGALYAVCGYNLILSGLFNALLGALTAMMLSMLAFACFGFEAAMLAGVLAAGYLPMIFYTVPAMKEPLALFLMTVFLVCTLHLIRKNKIREAILGGACLGLAALVRGNVLLLMPVVLAFGFFKYRRAFAKNAGAFVVAMILCILPATIHNYIAAQDFVPINYADGFNLYIGNSPTANGTNNYPPEISSSPVEEEFATSWEAREALGHAAAPSEISAWWRDRAFDYMIHNPGRELELVWNKARAFWSNDETYDSYDIDFIRKNFDTILSWPLIRFWPIAILAAFGAVAAWRERRDDAILLGGLALAYMGSVFLFYVTDRYRLPVTLFLIPLAGAVLPYGRKLVQKREWRRVGFAAALAAVFLVLAMCPAPGAVDLTAFDWGTLATIYADAGEGQETLDAMHKAITIPGGDPGAQAFIRGAFVEHERGHDHEAENLFKMAMKRYPADGVVQYNYGRLKAMQGDLYAAHAAFQKGVALTPSYVLNYYGLAKIYQKLGDHLRAVETAKRGLQVDPSDERLQRLMKELRTS